MPESERHHPVASPTNARCCQDWQKVCRVWRVWDALNTCYDVILTVTLNHVVHYQQTILAFVCCYRNVSFVVKKSSLFILIFSFSIVLVCSCRLYLGMHTLYDIIIGLLISSLILLVTIPFSKYWSHSGWGKETCQLRWDSELRSYTRTFKYFFTPKVAWIHRSLKNLLS